MNRYDGPEDQQCAWCGRALELSRARPRDPAVFSGICPSCYRELGAASRIPLADLVGARTDAMLILDADQTIGMANRSALRLLGKTPSQVLGERAGAVLDCEHAHLPGGCGLTVHCSGCHLRRSIAHTFLSGEPRYNVKATVAVVRDPGLADARLTFSTTRIDDRILLEITDFRC